MIGLPEAASLHAAEVDSLITWVHILMAILLVGWGAFYIYCLIRFRQSANPKADYAGVTSHTSSYLEAGVAVVEVVLLIGFAFPIWNRWVNEPPAEADSEVVRVVAEQFAWNMHYPGADGKFGRTSTEFLDVETNPLGLDRSDPNAKDDFVTLNQLHLPVNKPVRILLSSKDVIHSFKLIQMRVTQDAIPGMEIPVWFTPTKTGKYEIACAQLCGIGHYRMKGFVTVDSAEDYAAWKAEQAAEAAGSDEDDFWG